MEKWSGCVPGFNTIQLLEQFHKIDSIGVIWIYILISRQISLVLCHIAVLLLPGYSGGFGLLRCPCQRDNTEGTVVAALVIARWALRRRDLMRMWKIRDEILTFCLGPGDWFEPGVPFFSLLKSQEVQKDCLFENEINVFGSFKNFYSLLLGNTPPTPIFTFGFCFQATHLPTCLHFLLGFILTEQCWRTRSASSMDETGV